MRLKLVKHQKQMQDMKGNKSDYQPGLLILAIVSGLILVGVIIFLTNIFINL